MSIIVKGGVITLAVQSGITTLNSKYVVYSLGKVPLTLKVWVPIKAVLEDETEKVLVAGT